MTKVYVVLDLSGLGSTIKYISLYEDKAEEARHTLIDKAYLKHKYHNPNRFVVLEYELGELLDD